MLVVVLKSQVHAVLRDRCLSVDAPIQGATPALRHPWLAHHTDPEALVDHFECLHYLRVNNQSNNYCLIMG